jgi:hypothetical protein
MRTRCSAQGRMQFGCGGRCRVSSGVRTIAHICGRVLTVLPNDPHDRNLRLRFGRVGVAFGQGAALGREEGSHRSARSLPSSGASLCLRSVAPYPVQDVLLGGMRPRQQCGMPRDVAASVGRTYRRLADHVGFLVSSFIRIGRGPCTSNRRDPGFRLDWLGCSERRLL